MKRSPVVAGQFYEGDRARLSGQVGKYIVDGTPKEKAIGIMSPHAGLVYSGGVAGAVFSSIEFPETFVLLGPNHTGLGSDISIMSSGSWEVPTGQFDIDSDLSAKLLAKTSRVSENHQAHAYEHSLEVQLPFIAHFSASVKIVPITIMRASLDDCRAVGSALAECIGDVKHRVVIVASSDMSHYVPDETARRMDGLAIKEMLDLDPEGLYNTVAKNRISMCGILPATIMLYAALALGAKEAKLIKYATSGETSGDFAHVVGYAGVLVK
ncbi:MAG: AmmeMemoRadiSam system protein B [Nitrospirae bacterium]|nr:MAG: AmmeMemoRadiSam system protein B [Nitrospirota bacterium]